jgi:hypothetical protein
MLAESMAVLQQNSAAMLTAAKIGSLPVAPAAEFLGAPFFEVTGRRIATPWRRRKGDEMGSFGKKLPGV